MALSRPSGTLAQPTVTVPGVAAGGAASQGVNASAGSDVQSSSTAAKVLSGSASNGTAPYSYAWTLRTAPSGSSASISSASSATASLDGIDESGAYVCSVQATDANGFTDTAQVCIDYAGTHVPAWTDVTDIDLTAATGTTLTSGTTTVVDGNTWFCRTRSGDGSMSAVIGGTGLVIDFGGTNAGYTRVYLQIPGADLATSTDGYYPRIRVQVAFTGMALGGTNSFIAAAIAQDITTGSGLDNPVAMCQYVQTGAGVYAYKGESAKGTFGGGASGTTTSAGVGSDGNNTDGVLETVDIGQGLFRHGGHDGDETMTSGLDTFRAWSTPTGSNNSTTDTTFYEVGSGTGPWVGLCCRNKASGQAQVVTITRIRVQEYV
jgi:hypothetical protein